MRRPGIGSHTHPHHGNSVDWETPPDLLMKLGPFDDDPARPGETDGLVRDWTGFVWLNPPYSAAMWPWFARLAHHRHGLGILFARTETNGFFNEIWAKSDAVLFLKGRPHFYKNGQRAKGNSGGPVVIAAYGNEAVRRLRHADIPGVFIERWVLTNAR